MEECNEGSDNSESGGRLSVCLKTVIWSSKIFIQLLNFNTNNFHHYLLACSLNNGAPVVSRSVDQELNDVFDSIFKYYIGSWMEDLLFDDDEVKFVFILSNISLQDYSRKNVDK